MKTPNLAAGGRVVHRGPPRQSGRARYAFRVRNKSTLALVLCFLLPVSSADAQDWSLERPQRDEQRRAPRTRPPERPAGARASSSTPDRQERLRDRYWRVLKSDPSQQFAFERLEELFRQRDGHLRGLLEDARQAVASHPRSYAARMILGHVLAALERPDEARQAYLRAAELRQAAAEPRRRLAALSEDDPVEAARWLREALERVDDDRARQELHRELGELALERGDFDTARRHYQALAAQARGNVYLETAYARALTEHGHHERAIEAFDRVLQQIRGDNRVVPPVLVDKAKAQLAAGAPQDAVNTLKQARRRAGARAGVTAEIDTLRLEAHRRAGTLRELADELAQRTHRDADEQRLLGRIWDELGEHTRALDAYRSALRRRPRDVELHVAVIRLLSRQGRLDEVVEAYRRLIRVAPGQPRFVVELAELLMQKGERSRALALLERTARRFSKEPKVQRALFELYGKWEEPRRAMRALQRLTRIEPEDPEHWITLGEQLLQKGQKEAALRAWQRILETSADKAQAHATLGGLYADHDMLERALKHYRKAVERKGDELRFVRGYARALERAQRRHAAVEQWQRVLVLAGEERGAQREARRRIVALWMQEGSLRRRLAELERRFARAADAKDRGTPESSASLEDPLEAGRFLAEAYLALARSRHARATRYKRKAEEVLERLTRLRPGDVQSLRALEQLRTARGDLEGAIRTLEKLVEADSRRAPRYLQRMAEHAMRLYRDEQAIEYAERAVEINPDDASAHRRLGDLYQARQHTRRAIEAYRRAVELDEQLFDTRLKLAEIHLSRGELEPADRLLRHVIRACPDDELVARAARTAIQVHLGAGSLGELEQVLLPLAVGHPGRSVYRRVLVELYDAQTAPWMQQLERADPQTAAQARERLERLGRRAIKPLLEALADDDPQQKRVAVRILGAVGDPNAAASLLAAAEDEGDMMLRRRALLAGASVADASLVPRLAALAKGPERRLRPLATWGLAHVGGSRAVGVMRELLRDGVPAVRGYAALGLGMAGDRQSAESLLRVLRTDRSDSARAAAAWALGQLGHTAAVASLAEIVRQHDDVLALASAHALGRVSDVAALEPLADALFSAHPDKRRMAAWSLRARETGRGGPEEGARLPEPQVEEPPDALLTRYFEEAVPVPVRWAAGERQLDALVGAARRSLQGPVESVQSTLRLLAGRDPAVRLGAGGSSDAARLRARMRAALHVELAALVKHPDASVRAETVRLLGSVDHPAALEAVSDALDDDSHTVQRVALEMLAANGARPPEPALRHIRELVARHEDWAVRVRAARVLGRIGVAESLPSLRDALEHDAYAFVREAAAVALGRLGRQAAVEPLSDAMRSDREQRVQVAAARALRTIGGPQAEAALQRAPEPVRKAADARRH